MFICSSVQFDVGVNETSPRVYVKPLIRAQTIKHNHSTDSQPLRGKGNLQAQEEPGDRRRSHAVRHRLACGRRGNRR